MIHSTFNPSLMNRRQLEETLVDRSKVVDRVEGLLSRGVLQKAKHHVLLVGPRGIGKSHVAAVIYHRLLASDKLAEKFVPAYLREDEWGLTSLFDLLVRIYESLPDAASTEIRDSLSGFREMRPEQAEASIWKLIRSVLKDRSILLIIENLDTVLFNIGRDGQQRLRALIQNYPVWNILATTTTISADIGDQRAPFYGFFDLIRLDELTVSGAVALLKRLALTRGDTEMRTFVASPIGRARVRAIQHIAGGNPRIFVLFYEVLQRRDTDTSLDELILEPLQKAIDALTPYYQSKMAAVSPLQQKILLYLCQRRVPATVTAIAKAAYSSHQSTASQLKQLLNSRYVRVNRLGREAFYELAEPLMRICIEAKSHDRQPLRVLVEFLRHWFYREELEAQLNSIGAADDMRDYLLAALKEYDSAEGHVHLNSDIARLCVALHFASDDQERPIAEELAAVSKIAEDWSHCTLALSRLGRVAEIIPLIERSVQLHPESAELHFAAAQAYHELSRFDDAIQSYGKAIEIDPKNSSIWFEQGRTLLSMRRFEESIVSADTSVRLKLSEPAYAKLIKAEALEMLNRPLEALETLQQCTPSKENEGVFFVLYGAALAGLDRHEEALDCFRKTIDRAPEHQSAIAQLGLSLLALGKTEEAMNELDHAYQLNSSQKWVISRYCAALFAIGRFDTAMTKFPDEVVAHQLFHLLLDTFNREPKQGALQIRLKEIESSIDDPRWKQIFLGSLAEFVRFAWDQADTEKDLDNLTIWKSALTELYDGNSEFAIVVKLIDVLLQFKRGGGLKALLSIPLEERRLLISEKEEMTLGKS